jgi:hypothetical protein
MKPIRLPLTDPFRFHQELTFDSERSIILDVCHHVALVLEAIQEGLAPKKSERNGYDQVLLNEFGGYLAGNRLPIETALRLIVLYEDLVIPNIDVHPGKLYSDYKMVRLGRSVRYEWSSEEFQEFARSLRELVVLHPMARHLHITGREYARILEFARRENHLWATSQGPQGARNGIVVEAILQDIRTALMDASFEGIPAASDLLNNVPAANISGGMPFDSPGGDALVKLYFDSAIYSPKPAGIQDALELRENPRIAKWRTVIRQWQAELARGELDQERVKEAIGEANSYIQGAKFAHHLVPRFVHTMCWSVEALAAAASFFHLAHAPEAVHLILGGIGSAGLYGEVLWSSVSGRDPQKFGWYLLANEKKKKTKSG